MLSPAVPVDRTLGTARSTEFDALLVAGGTRPIGDIKLVVLLQEAFRHCKTVGAWGDGSTFLEQVGISAGPGVLLHAKTGKPLTAALLEALGPHRAWADCVSRAQPAPPFTYIEPKYVRVRDAPPSAMPMNRPV